MKPQEKISEANAPRNVFCPYYRDCLNDAVRKNLPGWDCTSCAHQGVIEPIDPTEADRCKKLLYKAFYKTPEFLFEVLLKRLVKPKHR